MLGRCREFGLVVYVVKTLPLTSSESGASPCLPAGRPTGPRHAKIYASMIFINEWLPNPTGADAKGEFIELFNNGDASVDLSGWTLRTENKKKFKLSGSVRANGYLVLPRSETKLSLKNTDGTILLYNAVGAIVDRSAFVGSALEGESFDRVSYGRYGSSSIYNTIQQFVWGKPTPGAKNDIAANIGVSEIEYPTGVPLNVFRANGISIFGCAVCVGMIFAVVLWYAIKNDEDASQFFFGGNESFWQ